MIELNFTRPFYITMRSQDIQVLQNIVKIQKNQGLLLETPKSPQQEFLHCFGQRFLLSKKMLHKNIENTTQHLSGSFSNIALRNSYLVFCLENHIQLPQQEYPVLRMLIEWTQYYPTLKATQNLSLTSIVLERNTSNFSSSEQLISYLNFIGADILKLIKKRDFPQNSQADKESVDRFQSKILNPQDLLFFLSNCLPKILLNILLPSEILPTQLKKTYESFECLYKNQSAEYYLRSKLNYSTLIRILIKILMEMELKPLQQKLFMEIVIRYFYAFHHDKKYMATELFIKAYNKLSQTVRFALSDQFILFFRIAEKIGKSQFLNFLLKKSTWLKDVTSKINAKSLIGYTKDTLNLLNSGIVNTIVVQSNTIKTRSFQVLEDYSLFYFKVDILSLDITIRLYYLGGVDAERPIKTLLIQQQKSVGLRNSIMAVRKGIYQFEFDNTYSWINNKTVRYENIVLTPLQLQSTDCYKWVKSYFDYVPTNQVSKERIVVLSKPIKKERQRSIDAVGNITKKGPFFTLILTKPNHIYEFQTLDQDKFVYKFKEINSNNNNCNWTINGKPLQDSTQNIENILGINRQTKSVAAKKTEIKKKEIIQINYDEYTEQQSITSELDSTKQQLIKE